VLRKIGLQRIEQCRVRRIPSGECNGANRRSTTAEEHKSATLLPFESVAIPRRVLIRLGRRMLVPARVRLAPSDSLLRAMAARISRITR
jgi:hypothetical protein